MDKETLSNYGWIVICVLVLAVMLALATPFGKFVGDGFKSTYEGLYNTMTKGLSVIQVTEEIQTDPALNHKNIIPEGGTYYVNYHWDDDASDYIGDAVYYAGDPFPTAQQGDVYQYGNYGYCYQKNNCCENWTTECCGEVFNVTGWAVRCENDVSEPGPILNSINGIADITIGKYAFDNTHSVETVVLPSSITEISVFGFQGTSLAYVDLSGCQSLTTIGDGAFNSCTSLESITLPEGITTIGESAFNACTSLKNITLPEGLTTIGANAFWNCTSLTDINVDGNNPNYCSVDGVLYNKDMTTLIRYPGGKISTHFTLPSSVTTIEDSAFNGCTSLTSVTIPDGITTIGIGAFTECYSLESITLPEGITTIGESAFNACTSLTSINIPDSVTTIGANAFWNCTSLTSITIPDSVTTIGESAFNGCTSLTSVIFKNPYNWTGKNTWGDSYTYTAEQWADPIRAATILTENHSTVTWTRS